MSNKFNSFSSILVAALMLSLAIVLINRLATVPASADAGAASFIIQLQDDPAAVYKAKTEKSGGTVSAAQLQAYRDGLRAKQDAFLNDLKARGVSYSIDGVDVPDFTGALAGHVDFRYTLVLNAIALNIQPSVVDTIKGMPQVKSVSGTRALRIQLERALTT